MHRRLRRRQGIRQGTNQRAQSIPAVAPAVRAVPPTPSCLLLATQKCEDWRCDGLGSFQQNCVSQAGEDYQMTVRQRLGDLSVQSRIAASVVLAGEHQARMSDLTNPGRHFSFGIDIEHAEKYFLVGVNHLPHAPLDHFGRSSGELRSEPAVLQRFQHLWDSLGAHSGDHTAALRAIVRSTERRGTVEAEGQDSIRIAPRVGGSNHATERVPGEMCPLDVKLATQSLQVLDQVVKRVRWRWTGRRSVATQVIADAAEFIAQMPDQTVPAVT